MALAAIECAFALRQCALFAEAPDEQLLALGRRARAVELASEQALRLARDEFAIVTDGVLVNSAPQASQAPEAQVGHAIGVIELLAGSPPPHFHAQQQVSVLMLTAADLTLLIADHAPSAAALLVWLRQQLHGIEVHG